MSAGDQLAHFIRDQFRSVWSLELLLFLKRENARSWSTEELVEELRASDSVVTTALRQLIAGGLVVDDDDHKVRFTPATAALARLADEAESLYSLKPDAVRRLIVSAGTGGPTAFADSFRLRKG